jgi:hypothetical protein
MSGLVSFWTIILFGCNFRSLVSVWADSNDTSDCSSISKITLNLFLGKPQFHQSFLLSILWHADPLLGNDRNKQTTQKPLQSNGPSKKHISMATMTLKQTNGVFYAVCAEMLSAGPVSCCSQWVSYGTAAVQSLWAVAVSSWQLRPGTVWEPRGKGMSTTGSCYQALAVKTWLWTLVCVCVCVCVRETVYCKV